MASVESRMNIFHLLRLVLIHGVKGDVVEIGCNAGESSVILQHIIQEIDSNRELHAFDSFQGVPLGDAADEGVYRQGDMDTTQEQFIGNFERLGLKKPCVHGGWFEETLPIYLPDKIAFALLDADLYKSTLYALQELYPRLSSGGICLLGVYWDPNTKVRMTTDPKYRSPGVKKACDEFFDDKPERISILLAGNYTSGYFQKQ
jgi:O-methyltransferase